MTATGPGRPAAAGDPGPSRPAAGPPSSAWAPFRHRLFALMWGAQFVSNTGSWMQTVAAQWLMLSLTTSATYVALVQTAASLPVVLFAVLAGTIGDLVDRRKLLLITQAIMLIAAAALGALAIAGLITTWTLLALLFAVGTGQALTSLTGQTLQPELVSPDERPQAISLGAVNQNLARAVGPAIGGVILAATDAGTVFLINAISFAAVIGVIVMWRSSRPVSALPREHVGEAVRAGGRYVAASPVLRVILGRAGLFIFFASAIWALLPLTARSALHLGSGGYGLLLAAVGVGALAGAGLLPRLRGRLTPGTLAALRETRFSRRRTGASSWRAWQDATDPGRILEQFVVSSWAEHERQHQRVTQHDQERLDRARALTDPARPPAITHWLTA